MDREFLNQIAPLVLELQEIFAEMPEQGFMECREAILKETGRSKSAVSERFITIVMDNIYQNLFGNTDKLKTA